MNYPFLKFSYTKGNFTYIEKADCKLLLQNVRNVLNSHIPHDKIIKTL